MFEAPIIAGDSLSLVVAHVAYPAGDGWVHKLRLVARAAGGSVISLTSAADGDSHAYAVLASVTAGWAPGAYSFAGWVELGAAKNTTETGQLVIQPDPRQVAAGTDTRSQAERTLADLVAAKATWDVTGGRQRRYKIGEREMEFNSEAEIIQKILFWEGQLAAEQSAARLAQGLRPKNRILTRFTRPR